MLSEGKHFGEMTVLLPEHVPFRGLAQVCRAMYLAAPGKFKTRLGK